MIDAIDEVKTKVQSGQIRERIFALFCLTTIAIVAMFRLVDPENIVINIIVGITSFVGGVAVGAMGKRATDKPEGGTG
jgi:hypothetical protein